MPTRTDDMYFLFGPKTEALARTYLMDLKSGRAKPGQFLAVVLEEMQDKFLEDLDPNNPLAVKSLIAALIRTRKPQIFVEANVYGQASMDWSPVELQILSNVSFNAPQTLAFNDGAWGSHAWTDYPEPFPVAMAFVSGALLYNDTSSTGETFDTASLIKDNALDFEAFYQHYEEKLLPVLVAHNADAKSSGEQLVVNLPGFGCGQFVGGYESQIRAALPKVIRRLLETHRHVLTHIHTVNYDPYVPIGVELEDRDVDMVVSDTHTLHFQIRPMHTEADKRAQLAMPANITQAQIETAHLKLLKIVDADPVSRPGNAIWSGERTTDNGACFASSNLLEKLLRSPMLNGSQLFAHLTFTYDASRGMQVAVRKDEQCSHAELAQRDSAFVVDASIIYQLSDLFPLTNERVFESCPDAIVPLNKQPILDALKHYIDRVKKYQTHEQGFWFFSQSRGHNREANFLLATDLFEKLERAKTVDAITLLFKRCSVDTHSNELKAAIQLARKLFPDASHAPKPAARAAAVPR